MRITAVELNTPDITAAVQFYAGRLGFPLVAQTATSAAFRIGYSVLTFRQKVPAPPPYHVALLVSAHHFQDAYSWVQSKMFVLPFDHKGNIANFANWNAQAFYFHDAALNILEIITHRDLPGAAVHTFSARSIIGICEVGLVVPDVAAACQKLETQYRIPRFAKGPYGEDFAAMGEEDGLLIISIEGRGWLPTGQPALPAGGKVTVETGQHTVTIALPLA